ncbi:phosphate:Na+ symporter [Candidatus Electrothrix marina]|uniref:Phosphate:Na+ symporter n=1 Tax=Candidatus Electrothrix marina TaxID=1859130 RepID=A0A444JG13_9BACT|nr:phosphate:Na+ symporter [Candidatus Electrothrix marina]
MDIPVDFWKLAAGLAIFLYGMFLLEDSVRIMSGKAFRQMIRSYTDGRLRSIGSGALITAILQSSSAVSLMVLAFVGAGVMTMENGIGVMVGANIGTTLTAWIVAAFGFKIKISSMAFPLIACSGLISMIINPASKVFQVSRLLIGFGFLLLGLDYMKTSVEVYTQYVDLTALIGYGAWLYLLFGILMTAIMQASAASIAIILTGLNSGLITFEIAAAMVIGANIGTTVTVLLGAIGGMPIKKRVGASHLVFNVITGLVAFIALGPLSHVVALFFDTSTDAVMGLALFHTLFNLIGAIIFLPFIGYLSRFLLRFFPERKAVLTVYLNNTPTEVLDAATSSLRKETLHLFQECQLYTLKTFGIDEKLVFDHSLPFQKNLGRRSTPTDFYENAKLLHGEIIEFYAKLLNAKLEQEEAKALERMIYASRNIMNSMKNIKGLRHDMEEFDSSDNKHLNLQYRLFRRRLVGLYHSINSFFETMGDHQEQYRILLRTVIHIEQQDAQFLSTVMELAAAKDIDEREISSLLMANRLFSQSCRLQIFALKDLLLRKEEIKEFDHAMDMKELLDEEHGRQGIDPPQPNAPENRQIA